MLKYSHQFIAQINLKVLILALLFKEYGVFIKKKQKQKNIYIKFTFLSQNKNYQWTTSTETS